MLFALRNGRLSSNPSLKVREYRAAKWTSPFARRKNYEGFLTTFGMTVGEECGGKSPSLQYEGHGDQDAEGKDRMRIPQQVRSDDRTLLK